MGMNSNINGNYAIAEDGTIKRLYSELDTAMLNIIRVESLQFVFILLCLLITFIAANM